MNLTTKLQKCCALFSLFLQLDALFHLLSIIDLSTHYLKLLVTFQQALQQTRLEQNFQNICSLIDVKTHYQLNYIIGFMYYLLSTIKTVHMYDINYDDGSEIL